MPPPSNFGLTGPDAASYTVIRGRARGLRACRRRIPHGSCVVGGGLTADRPVAARYLVPARHRATLHRRPAVAAGTGHTGHRQSVPAMLRIRRGRRDRWGHCRSPGWRPSPAARARTIAWARSATCSLVKMLDTWLRMVLGLRNSRLAMSVLATPAAMR